MLTDVATAGVACGFIQIFVLLSQRGISSSPLQKKEMGVAPEALANKYADFFEALKPLLIPTPRQAVRRVSRKHWRIHKAIPCSSDAAVIKAMGCTSNARFVCWQR